MIKILHSADWQIGLKAKHVAAVANSVRAARLEAARNVIRAANEARVDAVVLAGDIFEDNLVPEQLVHQVVRILADSRAPVYVLPGNHDPLTHDSIYRRAAWSLRPKEVVLLDSTGPVALPHTDAVLIAAPLSQKKGFLDPTTAWTSRPPGDPIVIGVAHGSLRIEGKYSPDDFPISLDVAQRSGVDYLALGHWHGQHVRDRVAYSGTPETTKFGEDGSGQALLVEISSRGAPPRFKEIPTGELRWLTLELDVGPGVAAQVSVLRQKIATLDRPEKTLLRLQTQGRSNDDTQSLLRALEDELGPKLLHLSVNRGDIPAAVAEGRLAEIARSSPLVEGLLQDLASPKAEVASRSSNELSVRRLLADLALEVWR